MSVISKGGTSPLVMTTSNTTMAPSPNQNALEVASRAVEKMIYSDSQFPTLVDKLQVVLGRGVASVSGHNEADYSLGSSLSASVTSSLHQLTSVRRSPLPTELVEHFSHMQFNCMMGLFPEIERAWLTIDSDIYVWQYEDASDLAYFDGLADTILSVALLQPKPGIFRPHIKHLLCLATPAEIVLLGVCFTKASVATGDANDEMHLVSEPLFSLSTDSTQMTTIVGSQKTGRVFLGGRDGCLYEFAYWADDGWFGKKARKINHSTSALSFLIPNFFNNALYREESIDQIVIDDSRNVLYTRSDTGTIQLFDLGVDGLQMSKIAALTQHTLVQEASRIAVHVDKTNFAPIIGIATINRLESLHLCLLAVSASGLRFYFSTSESKIGDDRPQNLCLQHVRLPPGFTAASTTKPSHMQMCFYKSGAALMSCPNSDESDLIWLLSSDLFIYQNTMIESQATISLSGKAWAMDEVPQPKRLMKLYTESFSSRNPPVEVIQPAQTARKFVVVSAQGTHIILKLRPVDHLCKLLRDHNGPDNDVVKAFFHQTTTVQAIATALILACSQTVEDTQMQVWATKAFFLYGGEPRLILPHEARPGQGVKQQSIQGFSPSFHPRIASTPAPFNQQSQLRQPPTDAGAWGSPAVAGYPGSPPQQQALLPEMHFSAKHQGLYLYFSRLIRPIWLATLVDPADARDTLQSMVTSEEVEWIVIQLVNLRLFMEKISHTQSTVTTNSNQAANSGLGTTTASQKSQQDAPVRERQSLLFLQHLITHCVQVLGLWKIVCDHTFDTVVKQFTFDDQRFICGIIFRDLIISTSGQSLCTRLAQSIIQLYLSENKSTEEISNKLQEACPSFYNADDAISSKAREMIIAAKELPSSSTEERMKLLNKAVQMCKPIAARIDLEALISHLSAVHFYEGALELTLAAAERKDPKGLALHFYKNGEPIEDQQGVEVFMTRMNCYKLALDMMGKLYDASASRPASQNLSLSLEPESDQTPISPEVASRFADQLMRRALESDDQLFHTELYQWLTQRGEIDKLLEIRSPFIEEFLTRGTKKHPDSILIFDLLWKYYEKTRTYAAAAKILAKLAERQSRQIDLNQRLEYLSRAISCVKSGELAGESSRVQVGELLHDLEDKIEVARVQLMIADALCAKRSQTENNQEIANALKKLNSQLIDISELYQSYAEPFSLWECQLAILHCAGHHDAELVKTMWLNIIESELTKTAHLTIDTRVNLMSNKVKSLGKFYTASQEYFPLDFIVRKLELFSCQARGGREWVCEMFLTIGIPLPKLLDSYNRLYLSDDSVWLIRGSPHHLLHVLAKLLSTFADNPATVSYRERRQFTVFCLDVVGQYLGNLYTRHDTSLLIQTFRRIQAKLERL